MSAERKESVDARVYDVCIVGGGPAGITLADELARLHPHASICLLESGAREPTPFADSLRDLDCSGIEVKEYSRERVLGGASHSWAGLSSMLDEIDFEGRPWMRRSGWPLRRAELYPYYERAAARYRFPSPEYFALGRWQEVLTAGDLVPRWDRLEAKVFLAAEEPQRFGAEFSGVFERGHAELRLDATAVRLDGDPDAGRADAIVVRTAAGREARVRARHFVLACGAIENARLLLLSTYACPAGLGNERDQVGRYLMNHPKGDAGIAFPFQPVRELPGYFGFRYGGFAGSVGLRMRETVQREEGVLNSYLRLRPVFDWSNSPGVEAAIHLLKQSRLLMGGFSWLNRGRIVALRDYAETGDDSELQNGRKTAAERREMARLMWRDRRHVLRYLRHRLQSGKVALVRSIRVRNFMEMEPDPANRVMLGSRRDAFGTPLPRVHHAPTELDRRTMQKLHETLASELRREGWAELRSDLEAETEPWPFLLDASHHTGTTRMGDDPAISVVDAHCRVHSAPNVFIAGSSVFATSGNANPTFTIVALALRLAEHLAARLHGALPVHLGAAAGASPVPEQRDELSPIESR